ncbi:AP2/ERF family transcription factor [Marinomonas gallaica]|uniref:AP2/ERF family transcription factor n=1 Tax=Marinomonas gallaica TaxID=1806667 RepID=UPI003CE5B9A1
MKYDFTQEELLEAFEYLPETGQLRWKIGTLEGRITGHIGAYGYTFLTFKGKKRFVHRIIFQMHNGWLPEQLDHIDRDKSNNRIENLRAATNAENMRNRGTLSSDKNKHKGVYKYGNAKSWSAEIFVDYKRVRLGNFDSEIAAAAAYNKAALEHHGEFACLNDVTLSDSEIEKSRVVSNYGKKGYMAGLPKKRPRDLLKWGFLGIYKRGNRFRAGIKVNGKHKYLGSFKTAEEAARRYDVEAIKLHGDKANLNFPLNEAAGGDV